MTAARSTTAALFLLLPALAVMFVTGVVPLGFVFFYSVHDTFAGNSFVWVGTDRFQDVLINPEFHGALGRSLAFSALALLIEIPLGLWIALRMPPDGRIASVLLVVMTVPLLAPSIVVGHLWRALSMPGSGLLAISLNGLGLPFDMNGTVSAWAAMILMDVWHWTGLVVLLCTAGLRAIPTDYYRAAAIDGAGGWAVFRHIQLPKLRAVLLIALVLRFMDSLIIYTEAYALTGGGPGQATEFLSLRLVQVSLVEFDLGEGAAMAVIYFLIVLTVSWAFFRLAMPGKEDRA
ncbi:MAG: carbohydrate ABC transporter permease [Paracoccaceae bacterium]